MKINVLGTDYEIIHVDAGQDEYMDKMHFGGYCDANIKVIVILNLKSTDDWKNEPVECISTMEKTTIRHEIIHAFLNESGLQWNTFDCEHWAKNEEMVDWLAIQFPKLSKAFKVADAL